MRNSNTFADAVSSADWDSQHDKLHYLLEQVQDFAKEIHSRPENAQVAEQETRLIALLGECMECMLDHFLWEEDLMRLLPAHPENGSHCYQHKKDHADISERLVQIISSRLEITQTLEDLRHVLSSWLSEHELKHDIPFANLLATSRH